MEMRRKTAMMVAMEMRHKATMEMADRADMDIRERILMLIPTMILFIRHRYHRQKVKVVLCKP